MADKTPPPRPIVEAREPFSVNLPDGTPVTVGRGDRFYADDPVVAGREHLFGELTVRTSRPAGPGTAAAAETASAAPGERRTVTRPPAGKRAESPPPGPAAGGEV